MENLNSFLYKLWSLVNDETLSVIRWSQFIIIDNPVKFTAKVLESYDRNVFKTKNISSFIRQLNLYGFRRVKETCGKRDRMDLLGRPHDVDFVHNTALDGTIFEGQSVIFTCTAKGSPPISRYSLQHNGHHLVNMVNGYFKIDEVSLRHNGTYTCVPVNKAGGLGENQTTVLRVQARPSYWRKKLKTTTKFRPSVKQTVMTLETTEKIYVRTTQPMKGRLVGDGNVLNPNMFLAWLSLVLIQIIQSVHE